MSSLHQRWLRNWDSALNIISFIGVTWISPLSHPFWGLQAVFSLFNPMGEVNVIANYDQFFCPIVTKLHIGPIFLQDTPSGLSDIKMAFFRHTNQENLNFVWDLFQQHTLDEAVGLGERWPRPLRRQEVSVYHFTALAQRVVSSVI